ncbi:MAG: peptidylprolyl isomerase, partial [Deltaproteobacteria bacterium]
IVNDEIITLSDFEDFQKNFGAGVPERRLVDLLIEDRLTKQITKKLNLTPTAEEVTKRINTILSQEGLTQKDLKEFLRQRGISYSQYRKNIEQSIEQERLLEREIRSAISIKEEDIRAYYYQEIKRKGGEKSYHIRQLFFPRGTKEDREKKLAVAKKIFEEHQKGIPFEKLVQKYSEDETEKENLGDLGFVSEKDLIPELRKAAKRLRLNELSRPIETAAGIHLIELLKVQKEEEESYQDAKDSIYRTLYEKEFKRILKNWVKSKKEGAYIKILWRGRKSFSPFSTFSKEK